MTNSGSDFLRKVLVKIARRYELKGRLSGTMKVGNALHFDQLRELRNLFGTEPIRISRNDDVRIHFDTALLNASETFWLEQVGRRLGYPLHHGKKQADKEYLQTLASRLQLAFPELHRLTDFLINNPETLRRVLSLFSPPDAERDARKTSFQIAETIGFLQDNTAPVTISELGARFFNNSKMLRQGEIRSILIDWLKVAVPEEETGDEEQILSSVHVYHDRLTVNAVLYGPVIYSKGGREFDWIYRLYQKGEVATISWGNIREVEEMHWHTGKDNTREAPRLICCENEAPFSLHMREHPKDALLFTSGFPNSAVRELYRHLAPKASACFHWGDSDPSGLRIAAILHEIHEVQLYRCDSKTLLAHEDRLIPLTEKQCVAARKILENPRFPFKRELLLSLEKGWLEQESWRSV